MTRISGGEYILSMFEQTRDNILCCSINFYMPGTFTMRWQYDDALKTAVECDLLLSRLRRIGEAYKAIDGVITGDRPSLAPELEPVWELYVKPLEAEGYDYKKVFALEERRDNDQQLTSQEKKYIEDYYNAIKAAALKRLPMGGVHPHDLINRCYRFVRLIVLDAPDIIMENESRMLARTYALYLWAETE